MSEHQVYFVSYTWLSIIKIILNILRNCACNLRVFNELVHII